MLFFFFFSWIASGDFSEVLLRRKFFCSYLLWMVFPLAVLLGNHGSASTQLPICHFLLPTLNFQDLLIKVDFPRQEET